MCRDTWCLCWKVLFLYLRWKNLHSTLVLKGALTDEEAVEFADEVFANTLKKLVVPLTSPLYAESMGSTAATTSRFTDALRGTSSHALLLVIDFALWLLSVFARIHFCCVCH
jgi:hypothetical protein